VSELGEYVMPHRTQFLYTLFSLMDLR